jgi:hypothetical protein
MCGNQGVALLFAALTIFALVTGCSNNSQMAQVRGHVFYKDGTVPDAEVAVVRFEPAADTTATVRRAASGAIESDGSFELFTRKAGDGVHYGNYAVSFMIQKSRKDPTSLIPAKYTSGATSGHTVKIDADALDLRFEIEPLPGVKGLPPKSPQ